MAELTLADVKKLPDKIVEPAKKVFVKMAECEQVREDVIPMKKAVLKKHQFTAHHVREGEITITDPDATYLLDDEDFEQYIKEVHQLYRKGGYDVEFGHCPLLIAESEVTEAEHDLIRAAEPITGLTLDQMTRNLKRYREYIDLLLSMASEKIKTSN